MKLKQDNQRVKMPAKPALPGQWRRRQNSRIPIGVAVTYHLQNFACSDR